METIIVILVILGAIYLFDYSKHFRSIFAPKWVKNMPEIKDSLSIEQWSKLEALRNEFKITDELFPAFVINSAYFTKIVLEKKYDFLRKLYTDKTQDEILLGLLYHYLKSQPDQSDDEKEFNNKFENLKKYTTCTPNHFFVCMISYVLDKNKDLYETAIMKRIDTIISEN